MLAQLVLLKFQWLNVQTFSAKTLGAYRDNLWAQRRTWTYHCRVWACPKLVASGRCRIPSPSRSPESRPFQQRDDLAAVMHAQTPAVEKYRGSCSWPWMLGVATRTHKLSRQRCQPKMLSLVTRRVLGTLSPANLGLNRSYWMPLRCIIDQRSVKIALLRPRFFFQDCTTVSKLSKYAAAVYILLRSSYNVVVDQIGLQALQGLQLEWRTRNIWQLMQSQHRYPPSHSTSMDVATGLHVQFFTIFAHALP